MLLGAMRLWREAYRAHHCPAAALMPLFVGRRAAAKKVMPARRSHCCCPPIWSIPRCVPLAKRSRPYPARALCLPACPILQPESLVEKIHE